MCDDAKCQSWMSRAAEADNESAGLFNNFDLPVMQICRSFHLRDLAEAARLLAETSRSGAFSGSPTRERWGAALALLFKSKTQTPSDADVEAAKALAHNHPGAISGVRDLEIAAIVDILATRDRNATIQILRNYLSAERRGRHLLDRQLTETIRELRLDQLFTDPRPWSSRFSASA
jgi:hypothetical protein